MYFPMLMNQCAPRDLSWMGRKHKVDVQISDGFGQRYLAYRLT